ncbi:MAG: hypothetical protein FD123_1374 [Bacteroidetes bacterium]|nr:MAG: hypothetical protein FD123_1374 [Bacteroidota bacterium]
MKKFLITALLSVFCFSMQAATIVSAKDHNDLVRTILKQLRFSDEVKEEANGTNAIVNFIINDKGIIEVKEVITDNKAAKESIERQMSSMPINKTPVLPNTLYTMKVSFTQQ